MTAYSWWHGLLKVHQGQFIQAEELVGNFDLMEKEYQFGPVTVKYMMPTEMLTVFRRLHQAKTAANNSISLSVEKGVEPFEFQAVGWKAVTQVLLKDFPGAKDSLTQAGQIRLKQTFWLPCYISSSLLAQFMLDLQMLEDAIGGDSRSWFPNTPKPR